MNKVIDFRRYFATRKYKLILITYTIFSLIISIASWYFVSTNKVPVVVAFMFTIISVSLILRILVIYKFPEISFDGKQVFIRGWFGRVELFEPYEPMEISKNKNTYIIKQKRKCFCLASDVIGETQFNNLIKAIGIK